MTYIVDVGLMGYSKQQFDEADAKRYFNEAADDIVAKNPGAEFRLVSGYSNIGVAAIGYVEAKKRGWKTVGVACDKIRNYEVFPCDEAVIIGTDWGDESPFFVAKCQVFIKLGGGPQSQNEADMARMVGKPVYEYDL